MKASARATALSVLAAGVLFSACAKDPGTGPALSAPLESISAGVLHTCGVSADASTYCWGWNRDGQLGDGTTTDRSTPVRVETTGATFGWVTAGGAHTCALATDASAFCWGFNLSGQLGDDVFASRSVPGPVAGGLEFVAVSSGGAYACGVTTGQTAYCWGWNGLG